MKYLFITLVVLWLAYHGLRLVGTILGKLAVEARPIISNLGNVAETSSNTLSKASTRTQARFPILLYAVTSADFWIAGVVALVIVAVIDSAWLVHALDHAFNSATPLFGWVLFGGAIGLVLSAVARYSEMGPKAGKRAIDRVSDIRELNAGEAAVKVVLRGKIVFGILSFIGIAIFVSISWFSNAKYPMGSELPAKLNAIASATQLASGSAKTVLHRALDDAYGLLRAQPIVQSQSNHVVGLQILKGIGDASRTSNDPAIQRIGTVSDNHLLKYKEDVAQLLKGNDPSALDRAIAVSSVDRPTSLFWQATMYEQGTGGAKADLIRSFELYGETLKLGHKGAQSALAALAQRMVVDKSEEVRKRAYEYFAPLADRNDSWAQLFIGLRYRSGDGVPADLENGRRLLLKVLAQDQNSLAQARAFAALVEIRASSAETTKQLDRLAPKLANSKDFNIRKQGFDYLDSRAAEGDPGAALWSGYRYRKGEAAAKDLKKAREWYLKALQASDEGIRERALAALMDMRNTGQ